MGCKKDMTSEEKQNIVKLLSQEKTKLEKKKKKKAEQTPQNNYEKLKIWQENERKNELSEKDLCKIKKG